MQKNRIQSYRRNEMDQFTLDDYEKRMQGAIDNLIKNFSIL